MRYIVQDDVLEYLPEDWDRIVADANKYVQSKAKEAHDEAVANGKSPEETERLVLQALHKAINAKSDVWHKAASALKKVSDGKCWYCESKEERSDQSVDHFRPKNSVIEAKGHPGYWWLAFDWRNYRYSCTFCNSKRRDLEGGTEGGKQDHFPIIPPPPHAKCIEDEMDKPKLLDPTDVDDVKLLTFLVNGFPHPAKEDKETIDRVNESITLYHLNHGPLVQRRKRLANDISHFVDNANGAIYTGDAKNYKYFKTEIIKRVRANAEDSSAARIYLQTYRTNPWVDEILRRDL